MRVARSDMLIFVFTLIFSITGCQSKGQTIVYPDSESSPVVEPEYEKGVIRKDANLREGPSLQASVITKLNAGMTVSIMEKQGEWYKILWGGGVDAYMHSSLVKLTSSSAATGHSESPSPVTIPQVRFEVEKVLFAKQGSNMRNGPGKEYDPPVAFIKAGAEFVASGRTGNWYYGKSQGKSGWIHNDLLSEELSSPEPPIGNGTTPPAGIEPPPQPQPPVGADQPPPEPKQGPIQSTAPPNEVSKPVAAGKGRISSVSTVKIRMQPNTFARVTGDAAPGQTVQILGCQGSWCEIKTSNVTGYVLSVNLSLEGN